QTLLTELSESIVRLDFPEAMTTNEYLSFPEEDVVFELFESDDIISLFSGEHDEETDDDSNETLIVSANEVLKSLENIKTFLIQQEGTSSYLKAINSLEKFIREKQ
ncbi:1148_t:CDS:1, partial [Gigaspora rosea]